MSDNFKYKTKEGSKKIIEGVLKGGLLFSKRVADGLVNANVKGQMTEEPLDKLKVVGVELGKGIAKGFVEATVRSASEVIEGVVTITDAVITKFDDDDSSHKED